MSEFLAEARILVRPDTTAFRADLEAALKVATAKPILIPVTPVVTGAGISTLTAETTAFTTAQVGAAAETQAVAAALEAETIAATEATAAQTAHVRSTGQLARGAAASGLSLFGLRGATLAASGAFLAGTAAVVAFSKSVQSAAQLETELNVFRVTAGATADEMNRVSEAAKQLGRDITLPGVTANTAAQALTELSKAGLSVQDSLDAARGTLQLATAAQIDNVSATNLVAGALNSFGLAGRDAVKVADLLTGAAKESQGEITDMGTALAQASAVSHQFGVSIEDTVTLLTELAQAGISGGRAGTSLRVAFLRLVNPPAAAAKALKELNVQLRDAEGNLRPQVFTDIRAALQGLTKAQQDATLATIFGSDAIRAAGIIGNKGAQDFKEIRDAITEAGLAQENAAARTQGLQGDLENLSNQASSLGLTVGQVASGPISEFVKALADTVAQVNLAADGAVSLVKNVKQIGGSLAGAIPFVDRFGIGLSDIGRAGSFLNPLTGTINLVAEGARRLGVDAEKSGEQLGVFGGIGDSVNETFKGLAATLARVAQELKAQLPADTGLGVNQLKNVVGGFDAQEVRARIHGSTVELLGVLNTEQDFLEAQLQRDFVQNRPALRRFLEQSLLGVVNDIRTIQGKAQADAEQLRREQEQAGKDAAAAVKAQQDALIAQAKAEIDRRNALFALRIQQADLSGNVSKENKIREQQIAFLKGLRAKTKKFTQEWIAYSAQIASLKQAIKGAVAQSKSTASGGFSLSDFFNEVVSNFNTFGSNIAGRTGVLSPQDARASIGQSLIAQVGTQQLTEAQKQTALLGSIDAKLTPGKPTGPDRGRTRMLRGSINEALLAAEHGYAGN